MNLLIVTPIKNRHIRLGPLLCELNLVKYLETAGQMHRESSAQTGVEINAHVLTAHIHVQGCSCLVLPAGCACLKHKCCLGGAYLAHASACMRLVERGLASAEDRTAWSELQL